MNAKQCLWVVGLLGAAVATAVVHPGTVVAGRISTKIYADASTPSARPGEVVNLRFQLVTAKGSMPLPGKTVTVSVWDPKQRPLRETGITDEEGWATVPYKVSNVWPKCRGAKTKSIKVKAVFVEDAEYNDSSRSGSVRAIRPKKCKS